jgi:hypothetical protein
MNEKYYTLVNGVPKELPNPIKVTISNPTKENYEYFGYKPKTYNPEKEPAVTPEYNPEKEYLKLEYEETDTEIVAIYKVEKLPEDFTGNVI